MFDIGFWEMVLVGIVALVVFGPERLPRVVRETALWVRKARTMVASVKRDIDQELQLHEFQESMKRQRQALNDFTLDQAEQGGATTARSEADRTTPEATDKHAQADDQTAPR